MIRKRMHMEFQGFMGTWSTSYRGSRFMHDSTQRDQLHYNNNELIKFIALDEWWTDKTKSFNIFRWIICAIVSHIKELSNWNNSLIRPVPVMITFFNYTTRKDWIRTWKLNPPTETSIMSSYLHMNLWLV